MGYRRRAGGGRRDAVEPVIIQALKAVGCRVWLIGGTGNPDLLVRLPSGLWQPFEVKTGKAKLTANQDARNWPVLRSVEDAMREVGAL